MMYNPFVNYTPPLQADGTPLTTAVTDAAGNMGTTTALYGTVQRDVYSDDVHGCHPGRPSRKSQRAAVLQHRLARHARPQSGDHRCRQRPGAVRGGLRRVLPDQRNQI